MFSIQDLYFLFPTATILASLIHEEVKYYIFLSRSSQIKTPWRAEKEKSYRICQQKGYQGLLAIFLMFPIMKIIFWPPVPRHLEFIFHGLQREFLSANPGKAWMTSGTIPLFSWVEKKQTVCVPLLLLMLPVEGKQHLLLLFFCWPHSERKEWTLLLSPKQEGGVKSPGKSVVWV